MKRLLLVVSGLIVLLTVNMIHAQPPLPGWTLSQNDPNPFCNELGSTRIRYSLAQQSHALLRVWSPDTSAVVRVLVNRLQSPGFYEVVWDGRNTVGDLLPNGSYPYSLTATEVGGELVLFEHMLVASVSCASGEISVETWSKIKALFAE